MSNIGPQASEAKMPKFTKPRIMLVDMDESTKKALVDEGFNVCSGSFGTPIEVERSNQVYPVQLDWALLECHEEQEILIINTAKPAASVAEFTFPGDGVEALWQAATRGNIDSRPLMMRSIQTAIDAIVDHGGICIVLLGNRYQSTILRGHMYGRTNFRDTEREMDVSSWDFSSDTERLRDEDANGEEITFECSYGDFTRLLLKGANGARYQTCIEPNYDQRDYWVPLATNKFGRTVAAFLFREDPKTAILLLPQMPEFSKIAVELVRDWCASWRPHLFPYHEKQAWLYSDRYELPNICKKKTLIEKVRANAESQMATLELEIAAERTANADWYNLLSGTGDELVKAVIKSMCLLGFTKVVDMDDEARQNGTETSLREDVQIRDSDPLLVVDIKGIVGTPDDSEATQAQKHATMRVRELNKYVKPLTIINPQRNLPPHERNPTPYRSEIVENAADTGLGLMTTWDIFLLLRNKERLNWLPAQVTPVFYRSGRIEAIPEHYSEIGTIVHVWKEAIGIIPNTDFQPGTIVSVFAEEVFHEFAAGSIYVDGKPAAAALSGRNCGIACTETRRFREGMRVFLVASR